MELTHTTAVSLGGGIFQVEGVDLPEGETVHVMMGTEKDVNMLMPGSSMARIWNDPEEDAAWAYLGELYPDKD